MRIEEQTYLDFSDVLLKPKRSTLKSRSDVNIHREFQFPYSKTTLYKIPIMNSNMDTVGNVNTMKALSSKSMISIPHKHFTVEESLKSLEYFTRFVSIGSSKDDIEKYKQIYRRFQIYPDICLDVANGYTESFVDTISILRDYVKDNAIIMAGNVATPEMTEELILKGADIVKIGIGSGAMCTTRRVAGVGIPQLTSVIECADAAHGIKGLVCSDGGITCPADMVKAFAAGADFVMIGSQLAGHIDNSEIVDGKVKIYGMSSSTAMDKYNGGVAHYRSSEGRTAEIPVKGYLTDTIDYYLGGLRSAMTYIGAKEIKEISKRATFIKVNRTLNNIYDKETIKVM